MYERPYNPYRNNTDIIKNYFKSPVVLVLAILTVVSIILSVVSTFVMKDYVAEIITGITNYFDANILQSGSDPAINKSISEGLHQAAANSGLYSMLGSISVFSVLTAIGLFIIYFKSRSKKPEASPSAGVTLLYVLAIFALIGAVIAVIALVLLSVLLFFAYVEFKKKADLAFTVTVSGQALHIDATVMLIIAISMAVTAVIVGGIMLFFAINRVRFLSSVRTSMNSVELSRKGAKPYGIFCTVGAVLTGMGLLSSIPALFVSNQNTFRELGIVIKTNTLLPSIFSLVSTLVSQVMMVLQARIALGYARYIDNKKHGYIDPVAPSSYAPAGAGMNPQQTPYSYLAQQKSDPGVSMKEATFVNPYAKPETAEKAAETKPTCPACGAPVDGNAPFCGQCGTKL